MFYSGYGMCVPLIWMLSIIGCTTCWVFPLQTPLQTAYTEPRLLVGILGSSLLLFAWGKWLNRDKTPYVRDFFGQKKEVIGGRHSFQGLAMEHWGLVTLGLGLGGLVIHHFS